MKRDLVEINFKKNVFILIVSVCLLFCTAAIGAPDTISDYEVTYGETTVTLQLTREDLRGPHFELLVQQSDGSYDEITPTPERSYIGTVDECPGAVACGILYAWGGFEGAIYHNRGETWWFFHHEVIDVDAAGEASKSSAFFVQWPTSPTVTPDQAGTDMIAFDVGIDALYVYHDLYGGDPNDTFSRIELVVAKVRAQYMKDVLLRPYLGRVIIRADEAASPYAVSKIGWSVVPDHVKGEWDANHTDTSKDTFACFAYTRIGGGLGTVGSIGGSGGSVNGSGDPTVIWRHELGHNWGCGHYVGGSPEGAGLMGGNSPARFTGPEAYKVLAHRDSRSAGILDNEGAFTSTPMAPYASLDMLAGQEAKTSYTDVLANDHDANGDTLTINTFDS
ncbi:MAG: hypothetical protein GY799_13330, partial [Desulfobulbaceae bacterium]|nr:hypothetical protein [Desulfobulbaceae bacterium]